MKGGIMFLAIFLSLSLQAEDVEWKPFPEPEKLADMGFIYTALDTHVRLLSKKKEIETPDLELLEDLVLKANVEALEDYDKKVLARFPVASVQFLLGRSAWEEKKFNQARQWLLNVPKWHRYYPEARFIMADMAADAGKIGDREAFEEQCYQTAEKRANEVNSKLLKRYYTVLGEDCRVLRARKLYKEARFQEAIDEYNKISKRAYKFPYILLEKAWAHYNLKDYNRSLGILVTYKAPLMESYFFPESEVLTALSYFRLCLYDDSLVVIDEYYNNYKAKSDALESMLKAHQNSQTHFYNLMNLSSEERKKLNPFIAKLAAQVRQRPRFALDYSSLENVQSEMKKFENLFYGLSTKEPARKWMQESLKQIKAVEENLKGRINYHAKKDMFDFIKEVYVLSEEMFKIKLEIIARKKDLVYGQKKLISDRGRGDFSEVKRSRFEAFWKFHGAFWADELGDFSFGLANNCQTVRKEVPNE